MSATFEEARLALLLEKLERMAGGDLANVIPISPAHDGLDAIAFGINALVDELRFSADDLRRAKEAAESADRAKTVFVRNISHEIRTPITAILALSQLLGETELEPARRDELVARIHSNARALAGLVDEVLDLSKVVAGKLELEVAPMDPLEAIAEVVHSLQPQALKKPILVSFDAADGMPASIDSDARRVRQILMNVIGNALKFTARGTIHARLRGLDGDPTRLAIDVTDTGLGMTEEQQGKLFVPFQQADPSISLAYGGTGLGLVLSKRLAEGLGGGLTLLSSAPGVGSTFRVTLSISAAGERTFVAREPSHPLPALTGLRILLVDDNLDIRLPVAELLALAGARVEEAADGHEAIARATAGAFDLILMDVRMPSLDGLQATRLLRDRGCRVPILALTADAMMEQHAECMAAGYDDYIAKPIDWSQLVHRVLRACRTPARAQP